MIYKYTHGHHDITDIIRNVLSKTKSQDLRYLVNTRNTQSTIHTKVFKYQTTAIVNSYPKECNLILENK